MSDKKQTIAWKVRTGSSGAVDWEARALAAEAELASVREERDAAYEQTYRLAQTVVEAGKLRDAATARVAQLEAALRERDALLAEMTSGDPHFVTPHDQRYISTFGRCFTCGQLWPCAHVRARALLASQPLPSEPEEQNDSRR